MGASLGGTVMARAISKDSRDPLPVQFLTGDGARDAQWPQFLAVLESQLPDAARRERAVRAAVTTFCAFESWMNGWMPQ